MVILKQGDERGLRAALSLEDTVRLLTGADNGRTLSSRESAATRPRSSPWFSMTMLLCADFDC